MRPDNRKNHECVLRFSLALIVSLLVPGAVQAQRESLTADQVVRLAQTNNPDLRTLAGEIDAAKARLLGASLLLQGNPSLTLTAGPRSSPIGRSRDENIQLMQPIEIGGKRNARIEAAAAMVDVAEARLKARQAEIAAEVREAFGRALATGQKVRLAAEAHAIAREGFAAAQERFETGAAALLEVNTARVEAGRLARDMAEAERRKTEAQADLFLLLGLDFDQAARLEGDLRAEHQGDLDEGLLIAQALANRAEITASRRALDAAKAQARFTERERIPTLRLGVSYTREEESDTDIVQGLVSFDLPIFNRNQEARGVAAARVSQLETEMEVTRRRIQQEVATALARLRAARLAAASFAGEVAMAMEENLELSTESYRAGKIDFLQLLVIRRQALEAKSEHIDVLEELNAASAQLERATGGGR